MVRWFGLALVLVACGGGEDDSVPVTTTGGGGGQCGDVTEHDVVVRSRVVDTDQQPVEGAEVRLMENTWNSQGKIYGSGNTDAQGVVEFTALNVTSVEDCWGVVLNYTLEAQLGARSGSDTYNSSLFNAINGDGVSDTTSFPIVIQ